MTPARYELGHPGVAAGRNPGSDHLADVLRGAIVDIAGDGRFMEFLFTTG